MRLEITGRADAKQEFQWIWGMYVDGFDQKHHCLRCLKGRKATDPFQDAGRNDFELADSAPYFYLFAMGKAPKRCTNVHLVVRPHPGAVASVGSMYGAVFTIQDALAVEVSRLPDRWMGLETEFTRCRNFQFGVQEFGYRPPESVVHPGEHSLLPKKADECSL